MTSFLMSVLFSPVSTVRLHGRPSITPSTWEVRVAAAAAATERRPVSGSGACVMTAGVRPHSPARRCFPPASSGGRTESGGPVGHNLSSRAVPTCPSKRPCSVSPGPILRPAPSVALVSFGVCPGPPGASLNEGLELQCLGKGLLQICNKRLL
ncbi:hypothetical protein E2C01_019668 [Portunus trituberculatus]|uniref:Secreted protein n=1 Tax=Portunus trituberculatus TaxID=210409 RepID=A0A5B7DZ36_PORTR|nr:hypothetical protein [Portunus trituberculatus]